MSDGFASLMRDLEDAAEAGNCMLFAFVLGTVLDRYAEDGMEPGELRLVAEGLCSRGRCRPAHLQPNDGAWRAYLSC